MEDLSRPTPEYVPPPRREARTSRAAIAALVLGLLSLFRIQISLGLVGAFLAIAVGVFALTHIAEADEPLKGKGWAIAGIAMGAVEIVWFAVWYFTRG